MRRSTAALLVLGLGLVVACTGPPEASPTARSTAAQSPGFPTNPTASASAPSSPSSAEPMGLRPSGPTQIGIVTRVVDGDTIHVDLNGTDYTVRYIGVDTPETVAPGRPVEWMGPEASAANHALVDGKTVVLERDVSETDRYGRLLRYVWLGGPGSWLLINRELVLQGYATSSTYPPDVKYQEVFIEAEREARAAGVGLWGPSPSSSAPSAGSGAGCDPAYPSVCIAPPPPDLDCADVPYRRFTVLAPDPHRFDGNHDGVGCES